MPGVTNRGLKRLIEHGVTRVWRDKNGNPATWPANWYAALVLSTGPQPTKDTDTLGQLTQPVGNGYPAGGNAVPSSSAGWPSFTEDDTLDKAVAAIVDQLFSAVGGPIGPNSKIVLTDDTMPTGSIGERQVMMWFDIQFDPGQTSYTIEDGTSTNFTNLTLEGQSP